MKKLYAWVCTLALYAGPAFAQAPQCQPWEQIVAGAQQVPVFSAPRILTGKARELANAIFNSFPPESNATFDLIAVIDIANEAGGGGLLLVGNNSQICGAVRIDKAHWQAFKNATEGTPS